MIFMFIPGLADGGGDGDVVEFVVVGDGDVVVVGDVADDVDAISVTAKEKNIKKTF